MNLSDYTLYFLTAPLFEIRKGKITYASLKVTLK